MALKKRKHRREALEFSLNITSLLDVLTVLLFFLLLSFNVSSSSLDTPGDVRLPEISSQTPIEETVSVSISEKEIRANNQLLMPLAAGKFRNQDLGSDQRTLLPLKKFLDAEFKKRNAVYQGQGDLSFLPPGKIILQVDKGLQFALVKNLLYTSAASGYSDYEFAVLQPE